MQRNVSSSGNNPSKAKPNSIRAILHEYATTKPPQDPPSKKANSPLKPSTASSISSPAVAYDSMNMRPSCARSINSAPRSSKSGSSESSSKVNLPSVGLSLDLRISIREKGVFACFHPDAGDLFNVCSDLKRVCWTLYKPDIRLEKHVRRIPPYANRSKRTLISSAHSFLNSATVPPHPRTKPSPSWLAPRTPNLSWRKSSMGRECSCICEAMARNGSTALARPKIIASRRLIVLIVAYLYGAHIGEGSLTQHISNAFHENIQK